MADDNNVNTTSLNNMVDRRIPPVPVVKEEYSNGDEGAKIASKHTPEIYASDPGRSFALAEIERTINNQILSQPRQKISQFGLGLTRRNDFRMRDLTRKIDEQTAREFQPKGTSQRSRLSDLAVRSHSLKVIQTNAVLGSYQFQKTAVLPYMRKSLALDYQRTDLMKRMVVSITGMERSLLTKLEAIKMNTAAAAPLKQSLFGRLKNAIRDKQVERVATNVANVLLDRHAATWDKFAAPLLRDLDKKIQQPGKAGGVNGALRGITSKLNLARKSMDKVATGDDPTAPMGSMKQRASRVGSGVITGAVKVGQKLRLPGLFNGLVSGPLRNVTETLSKVNPFGSGGVEKKDIEELGDDLREGGGGGMNLSQFARLNNVLTGWRAQSGRSHSEVITLLEAIRQQGGMGGSTLGGQPSPQTRRTNAPNRQVQNATKSVSRMFRGIGPAGYGAGGFASTSNWNKFTTQTATVDFQTGQAVQTTILGGLNDQLASINDTLREGNKQRGVYERFQTKRQALMDKLTRQGQVRKGSYEDLLKNKKATNRVGPWGAIKEIADETAARVKSGRDDNDDGEEGGSSWMDLLDGLGGEREDEKKTKGRRRGRGRLGRMFRRGRVGTRNMGRGFGKFGRFIKGFPGGAMRGVGVGALLGVGRHFLDKSSLDPSAKKDLDTLLSMGEYGSMGSAFGPYGAIAGTIIGGLLSNTESVSKAVGELGGAVSGAGKGMWDTIFGHKARVRPDGTVVREHRDSLLNMMDTAIFGRKAVYSKSGEVIVSEKSNIIGSIQYGFEKALWGDKYSNGQFKQGTSLIDIMMNGVSDGVTEFKRQLMNLPQDLKKGFLEGTLAKTSVWGAKKVAEGAVGAKNRAVGQFQGIGSKFSNAQQGLLSNFKDIKDANGNTDWSKVGSNAWNASKLFGAKALAFGTTFGTKQGFSSAIMGWWVDSKQYNDPAKPQYKYVELVLGAYGLKNREMFQYVHSLESQQLKVAKGESKPFNDEDMTYMAGRFGFDTKNEDVVNYFKMWYNKRFRPASGVIRQVLSSHGFEIDDVLAAPDEKLVAVNKDLKKALESFDVRSLGLEPTTDAYNRYAKISGKKPTGLAAAAAYSKQPDPRDPANRGNNRQYGGNIPAIPGKTTGLDGAGPGSYGSDGQYVVGRKKAAMVKGQVKDQPEYKAAYQKLPPNVRKVVDKSNPLQFVLWSTSIQHGAAGAALIFQRDFVYGMDESGYIRSIYEDRARQFSALDPDDRGNATANLARERDFAFGIQNGTSNLSRRSFQSQVGNMIDPSGNYSYDYAQSSDYDLKGSATDSRRQAIMRGAQALGVKPIELAAIARYESAGSMNPNRKGGKGGNYQGLFQFGRAERQKYWGGTVPNFEGQVDALVRFARDRGYRPGMGWQKLYTTINAGNPHRSVNASDGNGTQLQHYRKIATEQMPKAAQWMKAGMTDSGSAQGGGATGPTATSNAQTSAAPTKPARPAPSRQAPKKAPPSPKAEERVVKLWMQGIHSAAESMSKSAASMAENNKSGNNNMVVAPTLVQAAPQQNNPWLSMNMKKSLLVTGK